MLIYVENIYINIHIWLIFLSSSYLCAVKCIYLMMYVCMAVYAYICGYFMYVSMCLFMYLGSLFISLWILSIFE